MFSIPVFFDEFKKLIEGWIIGLFGKTQWTDSVVSILIWIFVIGLILFLISIILVAISQIYKFRKDVIIPARYNPEQKRRRLRRQRFADHVESEIRRLNNMEAWSDNRFAELEAEVEAEGRVLGGVFSLQFRFQNRPYKANSLSKAIKQSTERLILLEGEPGSGKSVALRHVVQDLASNAQKSKRLTSIIPIYVNLKDLIRPTDKPIDRSLIERFILTSLNRVGDRDVEEFLEDEFRKGIEDGTWLFLFDSFDEIPEVLNSTDVDETIRNYADAIRDFLHGMNNCRGIVASREYRGPRFLGWPKFTILSLSSTKRKELIEKTGMPLNVQNAVMNGISLSSSSFRVVCSNPMFLNLLCEFMNSQEVVEFPEHIHQVFDAYIRKRLTRDSERIKSRFQLTPIDVMLAAEALAFCMTADQALGLNPTKPELRLSIERLGFQLGDQFDIYTSALEYLKIARSEKTSQDDTDPRFSFAHRRFQEYFATSVVAREPNRISIQELLENSRWRETTVVLLQAKTESELSAFIAEISRLVNFWFEDFENMAEMMAEPISQESSPSLYPELSWSALFEPFSVAAKRLDIYLLHETSKKTNSQKTSPVLKEIMWAPKSLHVFSIIQDGLRGRLTLLSEHVQEKIDKLLTLAMSKGNLLDKKWVLEVCGCLSKPSQEKLLIDGFQSKSNWINDIAYKQTARLGSIPKVFINHIRDVIVKLGYERTLFKQRYDLAIYLSRIGSRELIDVAFLMTWLPFIEYIIFFLSLPLLFFSEKHLEFPPYVAFGIATVSLFLIWFRWQSYSNGTSVGNFMLNLFFQWILIGTTLPLIMRASTVSPSLFVTSIYFYPYLGFVLWTSSVLLNIEISVKMASFLWWPLYLIYPLIIILLIVGGFAYLAIAAVFYTAYVVTRLHLYLRIVFFFIFRDFKMTKVTLPKLNFGSVLIILLYIGLLTLANSFPVLVKNIFTSPYLVVVVSSLMLIVSIPSLVRGISHIRREKAYYETWKTSKANIGVIELISLLSKFHRSDYYLRILKDVRENQLLLADQKQIETLKTLISFLSAYMDPNFTDEGRKNYLENRNGDLLNIFYPEDIKLSPASLISLFEATSQVSQRYTKATKILDEFCKLFEQVQGRS